MAQVIDDELWTRIEPLLPKRRRRNRQYGGRAPIPDRAVLTGILFVLRSGIPWNMLPREMGCGSGTTCWRRLVRWQRAGVWKRLHAVLLTELRRRGQLDLARTIVDSGSLRALRGEKNWTEPYRSPQSRVETSCSHRRARDSARRALHGGQSQRHHAVVGGRRCACRPWAAAVPTVRKPRLVQGDRGYDSQRHRDQLRQRGIASPARQARSSSRLRTRPHPMGGRAHPWPGFIGSAVLAVRYERRPCVHEAFLTLACSLVCWYYLETGYLISQRALKVFVSFVLKLVELTTKTRRARSKTF